MVHIFHVLIFFCRIGQYLIVGQCQTIYCIQNLSFEVLVNLNGIYMLIILLEDVRLFDEGLFQSYIFSNYVYSFILKCELVPVSIHRNHRIGRAYFKSFQPYMQRCIHFPYKNDGVKFFIFSHRVILKKIEIVWSRATRTYNYSIEVLWEPMVAYRL